MSRLDDHEEEEDVNNKEDECMPSSSEDSQDGVSSSMDNDDEPEFSQKNYDIEPCYYSMTGKSDRNCRGKVYRFREDGDLKGFQSHDGTMYRLRDSVFVEISQNEPYVIAAICGFKYTKREHVVVKLTRYFRADDIPDISLNLMKQERAELEINPQLCQHSLNRELFNSEIQITQPVSCLRGKCIVEYVKEVRHARTVADFSLDNDTFFFCLHYNQDSTKLAATHFAIRVGSSFQAKLPPMAKCSVSDEKDRDELLYRPDSIDEETEKDYIKLARCFRTYTLSGNHMLDSQKNARSQVSDLLMDEAIIQLHRSGYKVDDALSELYANDVILTTDVDNMTQDDAKKFAKGIKQLGKNFSRIHRELLPHHSREQLVSYYYLWKKTPEATKPKQAARRINPTSIKRPTKEKVKVSRPTSAEYLDFDSASESDVENNGPSGRACHHCYGAESKDWHHAGGLLLCTDCRLHYKKYGYPRKVENKPTQVPACLFKRSNSDEEESGVRTRAGKKEQRRRTPSSMSETPDRRSPSGISNGAPHLTAEESPTKRLNGAAKRTAKRPLHNGVLNNQEKADSAEPGSPDSPPPKLTNGVTNGHTPGPSSPNGETVTKKMKIEQEDFDDDDEEEGKMTIDEGDDEPMPVLNGFKKEESVDVKMEMNGSIKEESPAEIIPTTSSVEPESAAATISAELGAGGENGAEVNVEATALIEEDEDLEEVEPDSANDTYEKGEELAHTTKNGTQFLRTFIRSCGPRCSRTDLVYKLKPGSDAKTKAERKRLQAQAQQKTQSDSDASVKILNHHATMLKKEQQQQHAHQQQQAQLQQMQQLQAAALMGQLPPEVVRQMMPHQFGLDPTAALIMQQLMHAQQPQMQNLQQHIAMQHMEQQAAQHQQIMRMQEMAHQQQQQHAKLMADQQRNAAAQRERELREREQRQAAALQQQQQQAVNAANQLHPNMLAQIMAMTQSGANIGNPEFARFMEMHVQHVQQQAAQQQAQQQSQQREMERREREQQEQREREQRERERAAREREQREREQQQREQAAREAAAQAQAQAAAAAAQQQAAALAAAQQSMPMGMDQQQMHHLLMQQMLMNPGFMAQIQAHAQAQAQQQQQQASANATPLQLLQQGILGQPNMSAEMMRRLQQHP